MPSQRFKKELMPNSMKGKQATRKNKSSKSLKMTVKSFMQKENSKTLVADAENILRDLKNSSNSIWYVTEKVCFKTKNISHRRDSEADLFLSVIQDWHDESLSSSSDSPSVSTFTSDSSDIEDQVAGNLFKIASAKEMHSKKKMKVEAKTQGRGLSSKRPQIGVYDAEKIYPTISNKTIGIYTPRSRRKLLDKYMEKRKKRLSRKHVRYCVRKTLASYRPRVKGRFVKTPQPLTAESVKTLFPQK